MACDGQLIRDLTDNDLYTFSVCYFYLTKFPRASGRYSFSDRNNAIYPRGFAEKVTAQIKSMENIVFSEVEAQYMQSKCYYFPTWFYTFLRGYRFDASEVCVRQDAEGRLEITVQGLLWKTVFWEVPILAIVSELTLALERGADHYDAAHEYAKTLEKGRSLLKNGLAFAEFGTRRRFSSAHQDLVTRGLIEAGREAGPGTGAFVGTSNVSFAMKYGLTPIGTMSHQLISFCGAIFGYKEANFFAMQYWQETFDSDLGTFLYDTYGWEVFQENFSKKYAKLFDGLRVDSGDSFAAVDKITHKYKELNVDPLSKFLTFSNGLTVAEAIKIHDYCRGKIRCNFGIGTFLTCDVSGVSPLNIVIKLTAARLTEKKNWQKAIKLSDDTGKYAGDPEEIEIAKRILAREE